MVENIKSKSVSNPFYAEDMSYVFCNWTHLTLICNVDFISLLLHTTIKKSISYIRCLFLKAMWRLLWINIMFYIILNCFHWWVVSIMFYKLWSQSIFTNLYQHMHLLIERDFERENEIILYIVISPMNTCGNTSKLCFINELRGNV